MAGFLNQYLYSEKRWMVKALFSGIIANGPATGGLVVFFLDIERSM
jgi:hypothetical protein